MYLIRTQQLINLQIKLAFPKFSLKEVFLIKGTLIIYSISLYCMHVMRSDIGCDTVDRSVAETWFYCNIYSLKFVGLEKSKKGKIDWENSP